MSIVWAMGGDDDGDDGDDGSCLTGRARSFAFKGAWLRAKCAWAGLGGTGEEGSEKSVGTDSKPSDAPDALGRYQDGIRRVSNTRES